MPLGGNPEMGRSRSGLDAVEPKSQASSRWSSLIASQFQSDSYQAEGVERFGAAALA
jgi:hypothetical protein